MKLHIVKRRKSREVSAFMTTRLVINCFKETQISLKLKTVNIIIFFSRATGLLFEKLTKKRFKKHI